MILSASRCLWEIFGRGRIPPPAPIIEEGIHTTTQTEPTPELNTSSQTVLRYLYGTMGWGVIRRASNKCDDVSALFGAMQDRDAAFALSLAHETATVKHSQLSTSTLDRAEWKLIAPIAKTYL